MSRPARRLALVAFVLLVTSPVPADFQTALDAYNAGDYETAYREWLPLAEKDSAAAQFNIGLMFDAGEGRQQDFKIAAEWYARAAENDFARAQFRLGEMYEAGQGVERDLIQARKWFTIAGDADLNSIESQTIDGLEFFDVGMRDEQVDHGHKSDADRLLTHLSQPPEFSKNGAIEGKNGSRFGDDRKS